MARIRTIKPEFFTSLTIADLTPEQRLTFVGLWTHVDDAGRCIDDPRLIKAAVWPLDDRTAADIEIDLKALSESSLILRYTLNRKRFLAVRSWSEHQRINRPTPSNLPDPQDCEITPPPPPPTCGNDDSRSTHGEHSEDSRQERKGKEGNREGKGVGDPGGCEQTALALADDQTDATTSHGTIDKPVRIDVEQACTLLADCIEANGTPRPEITDRWRTAARLMIDRDHVALEDVLAAIRWSQGHEFWRSNILSMPKLREKYNTLRLQANRGPQGEAAGASHNAGVLQRRRARREAQQ
jgi:hypothetical protein